MLGDWSYISQVDVGPRYLVIEGPLGVGKTAFARLLSARLGARLVLESTNNPFLGDFYDDPKRHAFQAQLYFLLSRYQQKDDVHQQDLFARGGVVSDHLFARDRVFAQLNLSRDELVLYDKVYSLLGAQVAAARSRRVSASATGNSRLPPQAPRRGCASTPARLH